MKVRPLADLLRIAVGPLIWFAHLSAVYAAEAVICSRTMHTQPSMGWIVILLTVVALLGFAVTAVFTARNADRSNQWLRTASLILTFLSTIGVAWTLLPSFLLPGCTTAAIGTPLRTVA